MRILLRRILRGGLYLVAQEGLAIKFHPHFQPLHRDLGPGVDQKCIPWQRMAMVAMVVMAVVVVGGGCGGGGGGWCSSPGQICSYFNTVQHILMKS